jgi:menaquinone-dependent protoporphyrinogen oxidase
MDLRVLVTAASKHGSTNVIAERIGHTLAQALGDRGISVELDISEMSRVSGVDTYDAVVLGAAVYAGRWLRSAEQFLAVHQDALRGLPVWIFSSGPVGNPPMPVDQAAKPRRLATEVGARDHRVFAGKIDRGSLGIAERAVVKTLRVPDGDFRDWHAIDAWATGIANELCEVRTRMLREPAAAG